MTALAPTLQAFFTERLARQKNASPHTVAAYRDTLRMLVQFAARRIGTTPLGFRSRISTRGWSARSSTTSNTSAATALAPATPAWPRSTHCSASPRCAIPNTPR